jgi:prefoldin subunit 5
MAIYNNKGKMIGGSSGAVEKIVARRVEPLTAQIKDLKNQLESLHVEHDRVLTEVESLRKTVEVLASGSLEKTD